jgi:cytochrome c oxidase subunit II
MTPLTEEAVDIDRVWWLFFWLAMAVGALVTVLVLYCIVRYRRRDRRLPRQVRHNVPLEIVYTSIPFAIVLGLSVVTVLSLNSIQARADDPDLVVDVIGYQWQWRFEYPETGVVVAGSQIDDRPELVLPSSSTVRFRLTSQDVIHSFWIPAFRFKQDMWPGEIHEFDVTMLDRTGVFPNSGACGEYCGLDHTTMRFSVRVVTPEEFDAWLDEQLRATAGATVQEEPA